MKNAVLGERGGSTPCLRCPAALACFVCPFDRDLDRGSDPANLMQFTAIRYVVKRNENPAPVQGAGSGSSCRFWKRRLGLPGIAAKQDDCEQSGAEQREGASFRHGRVRGGRKVVRYGEALSPALLRAVGVGVSRCLDVKRSTHSAIINVDAESVESCSESSGQRQRRIPAYGARSVVAVAATSRSNPAIVLTPAQCIVARGRGNQAR